MHSMALRIVLLLCSLMTATSFSSSTPGKLRRYLIARHGETNFNKERREQGTLDTSVLSFDGISQAAGLGVYIARRQAGEVKEDTGGDGASVVASLPIARTWSSPMTRCRQTYAAVSGCSSSYGHPLPNPTIQSDLREIELCEWQGRLTQDIAEQDSENWNIFLNNPSMLRLDNGRFAPVLDCWERGLENWKAVLSDAASEEREGERSVIFIMCHGGMGQCMLLQSLGVDIDMFRKSSDYGFDNAGCIEIEWADGEELSRRWRRVHPRVTDWQSSSESQRVAEGVLSSSDKLDSL